MDELFIPTKLGRVFGKVSGDPEAPLILAIHGWSQRNGWHSWEPLMGPLADAGYRVVSVDMPGWGGSDPVAPAVMLGPDAVAVTAEIVTNLGYENAVLMGKSWGGGVALSLALSKPGLVSRLLLTAPAFPDLNALIALTQPVLMAWAEDDPVISFDTAAKITAVVPDIQFVGYPHGGHSAAQKNAVDFAARAVAFLKQ